MIKNKSLVIIIFLLLLTKLAAQQTKEYKIDEVVVTASRIPISSSKLLRTVSVINSLDIKKLPVNNIQDLLQHAGAVDLRARGVEGVQADAGIRGGTFEQTLILIDGVKIIDPQTGHHNLNLPISLDNIERIEVLKGEGSRIFGANAFSGAVNIITKKSKDPLLSLSTLGGQNALFETSFYGAYPIGITGNNFFFSKKKSDGYRYNTGFEIINFSAGQNIFLEEGIVNFLFGYTDKKFGANSFYSDRFPNQWERTTTKIFNASAEFGRNNFSFSPKIFWRRNNDDYKLDNTRPDWYRNIHKTNTYGAEIQSSFKSNLGAASIGAEINQENISSTNLGNRTRTKGGFFGELLIEPAENLTSSIGFFAYNYSNIGWKLWPGFDIGYQFSQTVRVFASYGKAFRIPTFTELYYTSPANMGNPNLEYEETTNFELGLALSKSFLQTNASVFIKDGKNLIDWVRLSKQEPWKVENVTEVKTIGTELTFTFYPQTLNSALPFKKIEVGYTYLSVGRKTGAYESKYLLDNLRNQLLIHITHNLPFNAEQNWSFRFKERENYESYFIIDVQIAYRIENFDLFLRAANLFNKSYTDISGIPQPGRWVSAGLKYLISGL